MFLNGLRRKGNAMSLSQKNIYFFGFSVNNLPLAINYIILLGNNLFINVSCTKSFQNFLYLYVILMILSKLSLS